LDLLAHDWRGWAGARSWEAVAGYVRLDARHDGHVQLHVTMSEYFLGRWSLSADLTLEPGEQARQFAEDLRGLGRTAPW
jgi:hypothetical protein